MASLMLRAAGAGSSLTGAALGLIGVAALAVDCVRILEGVAVAATRDFVGVDGGLSPERDCGMRDMWWSQFGGWWLLNFEALFTEAFHYTQLQAHVNLLIRIPTLCPPARDQRRYSSCDNGARLPRSICSCSHLKTSRHVFQTVHPLQLNAANDPVSTPRPYIRTQDQSSKPFPTWPGSPSSLSKL
jgi:hypothetical protein